MKRNFFNLMIVCMLMLTGCASGEKKIEQCILQFSGIAENEDYQQAKKLQEQGLLNEAGEYEENEYSELKREFQIEEEKEQKQVHVTIAENSFLKIDYFSDPERTQKIEDTFIDMNPGEKLYCSQPVSKNGSSAYAFSEFRIYEYDVDGKKGNLFAVTGGESLVLEIPHDYDGAGLSVIPVGRYEKQGISFRSFYYDDQGNEKNVPGTWSVDDVVYFDSTIEVDATKPYTVKYEYDDNTYYYVKAEPSPFSAEKPGVVEFRKSNTEDAYSVVLHPYMAAVFSYDNRDKTGIGAVSVNNKEQPIGQTISKLKVGDHLSITTSDNYRIFCRDFSLGDPEEVDGGYRYTIIVPESGKQEIEFVVSKADLEVVLDKSVGVDILFDISASGIKVENCHYSSDAKTNLTIYDGSIGVKDKISITAKDGAMETGDVLKVVIEKVDGNDEKTGEVKYIGSLPGTVDIALYDSTQKIVNLDKIFRNVKVTISLITAEAYHEKTVKNGIVSIKLADGSEAEPLHEGDIVEPSQKVEVSIIPNEGYYVSGKGVDNGRYTRTMKFSKYMSDIDELIEDHKIKKWYQVTLDTAAEHGQCAYTLNGERIVEKTTVKVREEDKLVLEYELTDEDYEIVRQSENFWDTINNWRKDIFTETREEKTIEISDEIDGTTVKPEEKITIRKKGE